MDPRPLIAALAAGLFLGGGQMAGAEEKQPAQAAASQSDVRTEIARLRDENAAAYESGDYVRALRASARALELAGQASGEDSADYARALGDLAENLRVVGRYDLAEPSFARALAIREHVLGPDDPDTLVAVNNLAVLYVDQGRYAKAEPLQARALAGRERVLGPDHPDSLKSLSNMALLYAKQGRYAAAEPLYKRALAGRERVLGPNHPSTLITVNNLAGLYVDQGRHAEAEALYRRALASQERTLGPDHPSTLTSLNNLAYLYQVEGRFAEAEALYKRTLASRERALGPDHPATLGSANNLAALYLAQGRYAAAEPLFVRTLHSQERELGPDHPETLAAVNNLAVLYEAQGRYAEAEPFLLRALQSRERSPGPDHPDTLVSVNNLASLYQDEGRFALAEPLYQRALATSERVLGPDHRDTLSSVSNLAMLYEALGRTAEAEPLYARTLAGYERAFGPDHPATLTAANNLAALHQRLGRNAEAEPLFVRVLASRERLLGPDHPDTLASVNNLAFLYQAMGRGAEAEALYRRALASSERVLGREHPFTLTSAANLALHLLEAPASAASALPAARRALDGQSARFATLGDDGLRGQAQQGRDRGGLQTVQKLFADAAWSSSAVRSRGRDALRSDSFAALQGASAGEAARAIAETAARRYAGAQGASALVGARDALAGQWLAAEHRLVAAQAASGGNGAETRGQLLAEMARIESRIRALDAELRRKAPQYFAIVKQPALGVREARALLRPDEAALLVVPSRFGTHVMAVTRQGLVWHRADMKADEVTAKVARLRRDLDPSSPAPPVAPGTEDSGPSFDRKTAYELYAALIAPVAASLAGKSHVFIAADGALASLPFGVLLTEPPAPGASDSDPQVLRQAPWFADAHALIQIPSLQSLAFLRASEAGRSRRSDDGSTLAGFGDPLLGDGAARGARGSTLLPADAAGLVGQGVTDAGAPLMDVARLRHLARLPGTARELEAVRALMGAPSAALRLEEAMTERAIRSADLSQVRILHLATHGLTARESGLRAEPGLVFTPPPQATNGDDGYLAASEVVSLDLGATDWVILSACNTAAPAGAGDQAGLSGLARAFFYAGARTLLVSHWPVYDDIAATLTVDTLRRARGGLSRAQALQAAMRAVRDDPQLDAAHPSVWAPFALVGEGR